MLVVHYRLLHSLNTSPERYAATTPTFKPTHSSHLHPQNFPTQSPWRQIHLHNRNLHLETTTQRRHQSVIHSFISKDQHTHHLTTFQLCTTSRFPLYSCGGSRLRLLILDISAASGITPKLLGTHSVGASCAFRHPAACGSVTWFTSGASLKNFAWEIFSDVGDFFLSGLWM